MLDNAKINKLMILCKFLEYGCDFVAMHRKRCHLSGQRLNVFDVMTQGRDFVCPVPWRDELTTEQQEAVIEISCYDEYDVELQCEVNQWIKEMPLVSVDTTSTVGRAIPMTVQIAFGHSFNVLIFWIDALHVQRPEAQTIVELLPQHLVNLLHCHSTYVLVSGEDEGVHFGPIHMVDVQQLYLKHRCFFSFFNPEVSMYDGGKSDLAIIGMVTNDYCHKPIEEAVAKRWFSHLMCRLPQHELHVDHWHGYRRWPHWRIPNSNLSGSEAPELLKLWCMTHDVWLPLAFVFMLVQRELFELKEEDYEKCTSVGVAWKVTKSLIERSTSVFRPDFSDTDLYNEGELSTSAEEFAKFSAKVSSSVDSSSTLPVSGPTPVMRPLKRKREEKRDNLPERNPVTEMPFKKKHKSRPFAIPLGMGVLTGYLNPRVEYPEWGQRCGFCASSKHTFAFGMESIACPYAKERLRANGRTLCKTTVCLYSRCKIRHLHVTKVCPTLHHICRACGLRGHFSNCQMTSEWLQKALKDFEAYAHLGMYTSQRFDSPEWGFFPRRKAKFQFEQLPEYARLLDMAPKDAYELTRKKCPVRIHQTHLWLRQHVLHSLFLTNRPEKYVLE